MLLVHACAEDGTGSVQVIVVLIDNTRPNWIKLLAFHTCNRSKQTCKRRALNFPLEFDEIHTLHHVRGNAKQCGTHRNSIKAAVYASPNPFDISFY